MWRVVLFALMFSCAQVSFTDARDIFVNNVNGDDARDGSTAAMTGKLGGPCRTIARALKLAQNGDRIVLTDTGEAYRESITLQAARHSGIVNRPFQLVGNGAVLDGSKPVPKDAWQFVQGEVFRFQPPRMSYQVLYLDGRPAKRIPVTAGAPRPELEPLQWCLYDRHVYFRVEKDKLPRQYDLAYTALSVGITLYEARHVVVRDLIVQGFQLDGVNAHDGVFDTTLVGLTCRGNGRSGVSIGGASRVKIIACLVGDNGAAQVRAEGFSRTEIVNCNLLDNTAPKLVSESTAVVSVIGER